LIAVERVGRAPQHSLSTALIDRERLADLSDSLLRRSRVDHDHVGRVTDGKTVVGQVEEALSGRSASRSKALAQLRRTDAGR
jgi:hypothetical protein